jgi:hypothetical protein
MMVEAEAWAVPTFAIQNNHDLLPLPALPGITSGFLSFTSPRLGSQVVDLFNRQGWPTLPFQIVENI